MHYAPYRMALIKEVLYKSGEDFGVTDYDFPTFNNVEALEAATGGLPTILVKLLDKRASPELAALREEWEHSCINKSTWDQIEEQR